MMNLLNLRLLRLIPMVVILFLGLMGPAISTGWGQQPAGLDAKIQGSVIANQTPLSQILLLIKEESGLEFILDQGVDPKVTFQLENPTVRNIMESVLPSNGMDFIQLEGGQIRIGPSAVIQALKAETPELITRTLRPENVDVTEIQAAIEAVKSEYGRLIVDTRNNQIIVTDTPEAIAEMTEILYQLDQKVETRVFTINYGDINTIADELRKTLEIDDRNVTVNERNGQIIMNGTVDMLNRAEALIEQMDLDTEIRVFPLAFADYELIDTILDLIEPMLSENGRVELDERTLRLIVEDTPARLDKIAALIEELDTPTLMVYLEVEIVTIKDDHESSFNLSASFGDAVGTADESVGNASGPTTFPLSYNPYLTTGSSGLSLFQVASGKFRMQLDALVKEDKAEIIASPRLLVQDDYEAYFNLGSEEPYSVSQNYGGGYGYGYSGQNYYSQRTRDVGTIIDIIPHISEAGMIDMEISVEDSTPRRVDLGNSQIGLAVDKTEIETRVTVKAGRTVVLGGLVKRSTSNNRSGVPVLSKIPIFGAAFRSTNVADDHSKLLIFITPILVDVNDPYNFAVGESMEEIARKRLGEGLKTSTGTSQISPRLLDWSEEKENEGEVIFEEDPRTKPTTTEPKPQPDLTPATDRDEPVQNEYKVIGAEEEEPAIEIEEDAAPSVIPDETGTTEIDNQE